MNVGQTRDSGLLESVKCFVYTVDPKLYTIYPETNA